METDVYLINIFGKACKKQILEGTVASFFIKEEGKLNAKLTQLALHNSNNCVPRRVYKIRAFIHEGITYPNLTSYNMGYLYGYNTDNVNKLKMVKEGAVPFLELGEELVANNINLIESYARLTKSKNLVSAYMRKILAKAKTSDDVLALISPDLIAHLPTNLTEQSAYVTLSEEVISKFKCTNSELAAESSAYTFKQILLGQ